MDGSIESWLAGLPARGAAVLRDAGRPLVTLSYAQSLDGCISARRGQPLAISGPEALRLTHRLRALHSAILVGIGTVLADDPQLTVRLVPGSSPRPVILDTRLRLPFEARLLARQDNLPWIFCSDADPERAAQLERRGSRVFTVSADQRGRPDLQAVLRRLGDEGIDRLMVEGGARVITQFLTDGLVDQVVLTTAPVWLGGLPAFERGEASEGEYPALETAGWARCGQDLVAWGALKRGKVR